MKTIHELARELAAAIAALPLTERIEALNAAREALHEISPFRDEPVDLVRWVPIGTVVGNDYNPNAVAPPEMRLLATSIEADGYTQPVVTWPVADGLEVVDGFHRTRVAREVPTIRARVHEHLPVVGVRSSREAREDRMASTVRHNRARGEHAVGRMSDLVLSAQRAGWPDDKIMKEFGMDREEVHRLKVMTGLPSIFAAREYSDAWEPCEPPAEGENITDAEPKT